jgi:hypothetical protein
LVGKGGFTIFWEATALSLATAPLFMKLFGAAFVLVGLYFVAGRFLLDAWISQVHRIEPQSFAGNESGGKGERPRHDPLWSVISNSWRGNSFSNWTPSLDPTPAFIGIENARSVFEQLQSAHASDIWRSRR